MPFEFVDHGDRIIGEADTAVARFIGDEFVLAEPERAEARPLEQVGGRREVGPIDVPHAPQVVQKGDAAHREVLPFGGEVRRIDQRSTRYRQAGRAAGDQQPAHACFAQGGEHSRRGYVEVQRADYGIVAANQFGQGGRVGRVAGYRANPGGVGNGTGVPGHGQHGVPKRGQFARDLRPGASARAQYSNLHVLLSGFNHLLGLLW
ncbi:hypothetical protein SAMN05192583_3463 [Sphingomonas gellani]|uniref:Uncharacterized protein n=1 Tax=Sphingomonas gellani TaxID=1166340 RepID=A0A1H8J0D2_9SPHN|nr:hypothetical protein SAMN05192583_3463 [Sphingomonas gellani]